MPLVVGKNIHGVFLDWRILLSNSPQMAQIGLEMNCGPGKASWAQRVLRHLEQSFFYLFTKTALSPRTPEAETDENLNLSGESWGAMTKIGSKTFKWLKRGFPIWIQVQIWVTRVANYRKANPKGWQHPTQSQGRVVTLCPRSSTSQHLLFSFTRIPMP